MSYNYANCTCHEYQFYQNLNRLFFKLSQILPLNLCFTYSLESHLKTRFDRWNGPFLEKNNDCDSNTSLVICLITKFATTVLSTLTEKKALKKVGTLKINGFHEASCELSEAVSWLVVEAGEGVHVDLHLVTCVQASQGAGAGHRVLVIVIVVLQKKYKKSVNKHSKSYHRCLIRCRAP